jgi:hypothetical protein
MGLASLKDLPPIEEFMPTVDTANELVDQFANDVANALDDLNDEAQVEEESADESSEANEVVED